MSSSANSLAKQPTPAEMGVWIFLLADMVIFALYFAVFAWEKNLYPEQFQQGQATLNNLYGTINTVILLVSSFFIAKAVHLARQQQLEKFRRGVLLTMLCGLMFLVIKVFEYSEKFSAGFHIASNEFYRNYFIFTGFHMVHVIVGLSLLCYVHFCIKQSKQLDNNRQFIEGCALYWHMVDLLWVILFALIYLAP